MKNAIVFSVAAKRFAIELRWVREVITLGPTTPVPNAPPAFAGVVNFGGQIIAVLELLPLIESDEAVAELGGAAASAILLQVESVSAALRIDAVAAVTTLRQSKGEVWIDSAGSEARLIDPADLVARARSHVSSAPLLSQRDGDSAGG